MSERISILIVDDEPPLLRLMQLFLARLGYEVEGFGNATEALKRFGEDPSRFRVVVADLTLPDMPGNQMALEMLRQNPSIRVLLCSGYPFEIESLPPGVQVRCGMLQKPFVPKMLTEAVEELLNRDEK